MKKMTTRILALTLTVIFLACFTLTVGASDDKGYLVVTDYVEANSGKDVSAEIQKSLTKTPTEPFIFPMVSIF